MENFIVASENWTTNRAWFPVVCRTGRIVFNSTPPTGAPCDFSRSRCSFSLHVL